MDVERIQKINNLALDLVKQGLAPDREQAIVQAERIYGGQSEDYDSIKAGLAEVEEKPEIQENNNSQAMPQDQVKVILEQNTRYLVNKLKQFQDKVNSMDQEIQSLKSKLEYNSIPSARQILTKEAIQADNASNEVQEKELPNDENGDSHPRVGNFSDDDVSVEKIFYTGK